MKKYKLVFDDVILKQLKQAGKNLQLRNLLSKIFDRLEEQGPSFGKLLDSHLFIYEIKLKSPPLRLYYKHNKITDELYVFEYEMKTSKEKQQKTINRLKSKFLKS